MHLGDGWIQVHGRQSLPKLLQVKGLLHLHYLEERRGHLHGMVSDFTNLSLKHEFQSAAKTVSFLPVHTFEEIDLGTFPKNNLVIY